MSNQVGNIYSAESTWQRHFPTLGIWGWSWAVPPLEGGPNGQLQGSIQVSVTVIHPLSPAVRETLDYSGTALPEVMLPPKQSLGLPCAGSTQA